jgi:flagellin
MALSIVNNNSSLNAQQSLNRTSGALGKSLERLSSGLKVNRGADGPAALVISEQQRAQIAGLKTAIDNTNKAVSVVQTAEGALNEVNGLLTKIRGLALDSANSGVNDSNALAANQAEINNALSTIDSIANTTKFGTKNLLNGQAALAGKTDTANAGKVSALTTGSATAAGTFTLDINTAGTGGKIVGDVGTGALTQGGSFNIGGGGLTGPVAVNLVEGDNVNTAAAKIQKTLDAATTQGGGAGKFAVSVSGTGAITIASNIIGAASTEVTVSAGTGFAGTEFADVVGLTGAGAAGTDGADIDATIQFTDTAGNAGPALAVTTTAGPAGLNNQVSFGGANGLNFSLDVTAGSTAGAGQTTITVEDNALTFQIGANQNETAKISIDSARSSDLAQGVTGLNNAATTNLSKIDITTQAGAQDAIKVVDAAINQVSNLRGKLGAFQSNTLESNARNLSATLENTTAAESVIRDTDFATEIANFTRLQTQVQAGSTVLGNANQTTQLVAQLLRG